MKISSKLRNFFFNITFKEISMQDLEIFSTRRITIAQKIRENVVVDKKKCLRKI